MKRFLDKKVAKNGHITVGIINNRDFNKLPLLVRKAILIALPELNELFNIHSQMIDMIAFSSYQNGHIIKETAAYLEGQADERIIALDLFLRNEDKFMKRVRKHRGKAKKME